MAVANRVGSAEIGGHIENVGIIPIVSRNGMATKTKRKKKKKKPLVDVIGGHRPRKPKRKPPSREG